MDVIMKKFNFKLVSGKEIKAELLEDNIVFEGAGTYRAKHLIALKNLYQSPETNFVLDSRSDMIIPNKTFIELIDELEDELGYIHTRPTVDIVTEKKKLN
jgi:hypothetical protein